jgi:hypothetical protein
MSARGLRQSFQTRRIMQSPPSRSLNLPRPRPSTPSPVRTTVDTSLSAPKCGWPHGSPVVRTHSMRRQSPIAMRAWDASCLMAASMDLSAGLLGCCDDLHAATAAERRLYPDTMRPSRSFNRQPPTAFRLPPSAPALHLRLVPIRTVRHDQHPAGLTQRGFQNHGNHIASHGTSPPCQHSASDGDCGEIGRDGGESCLPESRK